MSGEGLSEDAQRRLRAYVRIALEAARAELRRKRKPAVRDGAAPEGQGGRARDGDGSPK